MQLHLGLNHRKITQDRPPVQSDRPTVPSCNMAFLTTRTGLPTANIHPSHFTQCWRFLLLLTVIIIIIIIISITIIVLGLLLYITFLPFYLIILIQTEL